VEGNGRCPSVSSCYEELRKTKEDIREYGWGDGNTVVKIGKGSDLVAYLFGSGCGCCRVITVYCVLQGA